MLKYDRQTKPGLVALYDIRPGNGAGPFLQPRSPHALGVFHVMRYINVRYLLTYLLTGHEGKQDHDWKCH